MGHKRKAQDSWLSVHWPMIFLGTAAIALFSGIGYMAFHTTPKPETGAAAVPVYYDRAEDAMPFPATLEPATFKRADVRKAYQTAKEVPGVLVQQPCYCYCQRQGHRSLLDCFKTDHAPVAISASERHCSRTKCIAKGNPPRRSGERSFKASGPA